MIGRGIGWISLYLTVAVAPLVFAFVSHTGPGRGFVTELSVALGFIGLSMMGMQFALVAKFQAVAAPFGEDALVQFHRQISYVALAFILAHPILLQFAGLDIVGLFNLVDAPWRARFAIISTTLLLTLIATSVWRQRFRMRYEVWQIVHGVVSVIVVGSALAHVLLVGHFVDHLWKKTLWAVMTVALVTLLVWVRVVRPLLRLKKPWKIVDVIPENNNACTLTLVPVGHEGFRFEPGQFGWLIVDRSAFAITAHPFSFSSSAEEHESVQMTIKALGDFTSTVPALRPGKRVYLDGPHGVFTPDRNEGPGFVLIAGGVGITPMMSIVRTMADRGDKRPVLLFYANQLADQIIFDTELEELSESLDLTVVHIISSPSDKWVGERGYLDREILARHLPSSYSRMQFFACGPGPMLNAMEDTLVDLGVPPNRLHTERFIFV